MKIYALITCLVIPIFEIKTQTTTPDDYYYDAPTGLVNYDDDVMFAILKKYNKLVRPVSKLDLKIRLSLRQIISIEEKNQIMTSSFYLFVQWQDGRLRWNPKNATFGGLFQILMPATSIWTPDLFIINTATVNGFLSITTSNYAVIDFDGSVNLILSVSSLQTRCKMNVYFFPFDKQNCSIVVGSWQHDTSRLTFTSDESKIDLSKYVPHPVWTLKSISVNSVFGSDRFEEIGLESEDISFNLYISRGSNYYVGNMIACFILNFVSLFAYFIPFGQQIGICMTSFLTFSVQLVNMANFLPVQSIYVPVITAYFISSIMVPFFNFIWFVTMNYYTGKQLPFLLLKLGQFSKFILFWIYPKQAVLPEKEKKEEPNLNNSFRLPPINNTPIKEKCNKCEMCDGCKENKDKDDKKKKDKEENESLLQAINYIVFFIIFLFVCLDLLIIWVVNATS